MATSMLRIRFILQVNEKPPESIISLPATFIPFSLSRGTFCPCLQSLYCLSPLRLLSSRGCLSLRGIGIAANHRNAPFSKQTRPLHFQGFLTLGVSPPPAIDRRYWSSALPAPGTKQHPELAWKRLRGRARQRVNYGMVTLVVKV